MDFRKQFIENDMKFLQQKKEHLTHWEAEFIYNMEGLVKNNLDLTTHQFNTLQDIVQRIKAVRK